MKRLGRFLWDTYKLSELSKIPQPLLLKPFFPGYSIGFLLTTRCNMSCAHCFKSPIPPQDLSLDVFDKALNRAYIYRFNHVVLTGGEALLHPRLEEFLARLEGKPYTWSIVSNGLAFEEKLPVLLKYRRQWAYIFFSLDGATAEEHEKTRQKGSFNTLQKNFKICRNLKIPFRVMATLNTGNFDRVLDMALFVKKNGASGLEFTSVLPCPRAESNLLVLTAQQRSEIPAFVAKINKIFKMTARATADVFAPSGIKLCLASAIREVAIDSEGYIVHCCELCSFDDPEIRKKSKIANLNDMSFDEGIQALTKHFAEFDMARARDFASQKTPADIDFNSCFYCLNKLQTA